MKKITLFLSLGSFLFACGDEVRIGAQSELSDLDAMPTPDGDPPTPDLGVLGDARPDIAVDMSPDMSAPDMLAPDMLAPDMLAPDMLAPDAAPQLEGPEAWLYRSDPVTDGELSRMVIPEPTDPSGHLTNEWVKVYNCLNEPGGPSSVLDFGFQVTVFLCHEIQVVQPDADGNYLSISPPENDADPNDSFAELMMYFHVNKAHDYFKETFGFEGMDYVLPAVVNVQLKTEPVLPFPGLMPGPDGWLPLANAAYFPKENWEIFASLFGLPPRDSDQIIFFQGPEKDFAYDAGVIYHEYTHAVIGNERIRAPMLLDEWGLNNEPNSMHEGIADYFATSMLDMSLLGPYVGDVRDLSEPRHCPANTIDEVHANGKIIGTSLWALRDELGAEITDMIVFGAMEQFGMRTTFKEAGQLMIAEAGLISPEALAVTERVLTDFGLVSCERTQPWEAWVAADSDEELPHIVEGTQSVTIPGFDNSGVPAYKQFYIDVEAGTEAVELTLVGESAPSGFLNLNLNPGAEPDPPANPLDLAVRVGEPVGINPGVVSYTADARVTAPLEDTTQTWILTGDCLPAEGGRVHLLPINPGPGAIWITQLARRDLEGVEPGENVFDCAE